MVLKLGINEWPMPGRIVRRATYESEYHELLKKDGVPFVPYAIWKDMFFAAFVIARRLPRARCTSVHLEPQAAKQGKNRTTSHHPRLGPKPDSFSCGSMSLLCLARFRPRSKHRRF